MLGGLAAWIYYIPTKTRRLVFEHLHLAFAEEKTEAEIKQIAKNVFKMLGRNAADIIRAAKEQPDAYYTNIIELHNFEIPEAVKALNQAIIFVVPHIGAIEILANEVARRGYKPYIIGTPLKDERLNNLLWQQRARYGATPIVRGEETLRLLKILLSGGSVALLIDQDTKVKSCFVNFFGKPASTPIGAATLALRTKAIVIPAYIYMDDKLKHHIHFYKPVELIRTDNMEADIVANTQLFTSIIESQIRKHPEQWVWMHRRWKTKPGNQL